MTIKLLTGEKETTWEAIVRFAKEHPFLFLSALASAGVGVGTVVVNNSREVR